MFTADAARQPGALRAMVNYYRALVRGGGMKRQKEARAIPPIETPTLMIWGEQDLALGKELTFGTERARKAAHPALPAECLALGSAR